MFRMCNRCVRRAGVAAAMMIVALVALCPTPAASQTVTDAARAEFLPSLDHSDKGADGTPLVTSYRLQIFTVGSATPVQAIDLGKPTPEADGYIRLEFGSRLSPPLTPGVEYQARVTAVGPSGTASSGLSNSFIVTGGCATALSATSASLPSGGSSGTVAVTAATGCAWTASTASTWLSVTSGAAGTGSGSVAYTAAANTGTAARTGTLTIAGKTFTVSQAANGCTYTVSPGGVTATAAGLGSSLSVSTGSGCAWTASGMPSWITIASGSRTGPGMVAYTVAANTGATARSASVTIAGRPVIFSQSPIPVAPPAPANFRVVTGG